MTLPTGAARHTVLPHILAAYGVSLQEAAEFCFTYLLRYGPRPPEELAAAVIGYAQRRYALWEASRQAQAHREPAPG